MAASGEVTDLVRQLVAAAPPLTGEQIAGIRAVIARNRRRLEGAQGPYPHPVDVRQHRPETPAA